MSKYRRSVVYPSISKCNPKRCSCCKHLCCKSTIKSHVNCRQLSVIEDQLMLFLFYLEKRRIVACTMLAKLVDLKKLDFRSTIIQKKSLAKLIIFFIGISNKLITLLAVFLSSLLKRLLMMIIPLKDVEIFLGIN